MPRINPNEISQYQAKSSGSKWFSLKNDNDSEVVHFLSENTDDLDIYAVHEVVDENGYSKHVNCLRHAGDPIDVCPLCASGNKVSAKVFLQMYSVKDDCVKVWVRGPQFLKLLEGHARRINPLYKTPFEIVRNGGPGDKKTTYTPYPIIADANYPLRNLEDLPSKYDLTSPEVGIVKDLSYNDLLNYVRTGNLGSSSSQLDTQVQRRPASTTQYADTAAINSNQPAPTMRAATGGRRVY